MAYTSDNLWDSEILSKKDALTEVSPKCLTKMCHHVGLDACWDGVGVVEVEVQALQGGPDELTCKSKMIQSILDVHFINKRVINKWS